MDKLTRIEIAAAARRDIALVKRHERVLPRG
jgi:hypothetical protein